MTWNRDMSQAPLGKEVVVTRKVNGEDRNLREHHISPVWLALKSGQVIRSYWLPEMKTSKGRWSGCAEGEVPLAWQDFFVPEHPGVS